MASKVREAASATWIAGGSWIVHVGGSRVCISRNVANSCGKPARLGLAARKCPWINRSCPVLRLILLAELLKDKSTVHIYIEAEYQLFFQHMGHDGMKLWGECPKMTRDLSN